MKFVGKTSASEWQDTQFQPWTFQKNPKINDTIVDHVVRCAYSKGPSSCHILSKLHWKNRHHEMRAYESHMGHQAACSRLPAFWPSIPKLGLKVWWHFSHLQLCHYVSWYGHVTLTSSSPLWSPVSYRTFHTVQTSYAKPKQNSPGFAGPPFKHLGIPRQQPGQRKSHKDQTSYHQVGWDGINAWGRLLKPKLECQPTSVQMQSLLLTSNYSVAVPNEIAVWPVQWHINQMQCQHRHCSWSVSTSAGLVNNSSGRQESSLLSAVLFNLNHNRAQACPTRHQFWHGTGRKLELQLLLLARDIALRKDRKAM